MDHGNCVVIFIETMQDIDKIGKWLQDIYYKSKEWSFYMIL